MENIQIFDAKSGLWQHFYLVRKLDEAKALEFIEQVDADSKSLAVK